MTRAGSLILKLIQLLYILLFLLTPLIISPGSSEIFQIPKMHFVYFISGVVTLLWLCRIFIDKPQVKIPKAFLFFILFIFINFISFSLSIDKYVSLTGFSTRLNGGLVSLISFALLFLCLVNNFSKKQTISFIYATLFATLVSSIYALVQKLGFDPVSWDQDSTKRAFALFGQPNWLGSWLAAMIPITLSFVFVKKNKSNALLVFVALMVSALVVTKSRSAIFATVLTSGGFLFINRKRFLTRPIQLIKLLLLASLVVGLVSTFSFSRTQTDNHINEITPSSEIRMILWSTSVKAFLDRPFLGFGPETFAYVFDHYRPLKHNNTTEWNLVYSKAHNEYLNYLVNTGIVGLLTYLLLIGYFTKLFIKAYKDKKSDQLFVSGLFFSWVSVLISVFFGFSTATDSLLVILLPAILIVNYRDKRYLVSSVASVLVLMIFAVLLIAYSVISFRDDLSYNQSKNLLHSNEVIKSLDTINSTILLNYSPTYLAHASQVLISNQDEHNSQKLSVNLAGFAIEKSPYNSQLYLNKAQVLIQLDPTNTQYKSEIVNLFDTAATLRKFDPRPLYLKGLYLHRIDQSDEAIKLLNESLDLKHDFKDARIALGIIYESQNKTELAKNEYLYILTHINPSDPDAISFLQRLDNKH